MKTSLCSNSLRLAPFYPLWRRAVTQQGILFHVRVPGPSWNNVCAATPVHLVSIGLLSAPSVSQKTFWCLILWNTLTITFGCKLPKTTFVLLFLPLKFDLQKLPFLLPPFFHRQIFQCPITFRISLFSFIKLKCPEKYLRNFWNSLSGVTKGPVENSECQYRERSLKHQKKLFFLTSFFLLPKHSGPICPYL